MSDTGDDLRAQLVGFFFEEATEGIEVIEAGLVDLDLDAPDEETINSIFRAMHSIKGASGSFGFTDISNFAHRAETLLDEVRDGSRVLDQEVVDLLLKATDCVGAMVQAIQDEVEPDRVAIDAIAVALQSMLDDRDASSNSEEPEAASLPEEDTTLKQWRIKFSPHPNLLKTGNDPFRIFREVGDLGEMTVHSDATSLPTLAALDPEECHLSWVLELESTCPRTEIEEAFAWVEDECDLEIECGPQSDSLSGEAETESPETADTQVEEKTGAPVATKKARSKSGTKGGAASSIRVSTEKVDALINMVGELVITQSMLNEIGEKFQPDHLDRLMDGLSELERNTRELQDTVMKIRMLPISVTFARFPRLVRDLSQTLGKNIDLQLEGESTELDKTVLEQIGDPLVHLVRNSLDHGLETSEERLAAGKSERGTITLAAFHEGGSIIIQVKDDGRGLNHDKIRAKAIEQGILGPNESCDEQKISELILGAGFSTATEVSDVSGRGVGMDVVQRNIHDLGGSIGIQSESGRGTTTTIRLPLTLAILDGQLIRVGDQTYVIPLIGIIESLQIKREMINSIAGMVEVYRLRDEAVPILRLHQLFNIEPDTHILNDGLLVVVEANGRQAGLVVDELLNQQQVVIKSLEANYKRVQGLSGATILGDGTVALIIDIVGLIQKARTQGLFTREANALEQDRVQIELENLKTEKEGGAAIGSASSGDSESVTSGVPEVDLEPGLESQTKDESGE